jgi:hypothetical protein
MYPKSFWPKWSFVKIDPRKHSRPTGTSRLIVSFELDASFTPSIHSVTWGRFYESVSAGIYAQKSVCKFCFMAFRVQSVIEYNNFTQKAVN